jgi:hypothetical protein
MFGTARVVNRDRSILMDTLANRKTLREKIDALSVCYADSSSESVDERSRNALLRVFCFR